MKKKKKTKRKKNWRSVLAPFKNERQKKSVGYRKKNIHGTRNRRERDSKWSSDRKKMIRALTMNRSESATYFISHSKSYGSWSSYSFFIFHSFQFDSIRFFSFLLFLCVCRHNISFQFFSSFLVPLKIVNEWRGFFPT